MAGLISYLNATINAFPLSVAQRSVLKNSEFQEPFTGDSLTGWQTSGGWEWQNSGFARCLGGEYLYQEIIAADPMIVGANYEVRVGITSYTSGYLNVEMGAGYNSTAAGGVSMSRIGDFILPFNASAGTTRFHLRAYNGPTFDVAYCRLVRV